MLGYILLSFLLGIIPETIYFTFFIIYTKEIQEKKWRLGIGIAVIYSILGGIFQYKLITFLGTIFAIYVWMKLLYKDTNLIDLITIYIASSYLTIISYVAFLNFKEDLSNYNFLFLLNRCLIFIPLLGRKRFHGIYTKIKMLWNRNQEEKRPIKSITLRIISFISINILIFFMNYYLLKMMQF